MKIKTKKNIMPNNKKYTAWDYIRIPFMSCPGCTLIIGINRIVSAFIPSLVVLITANFIDTAIAVFNGEKSFNAIYLPILCYMLERLIFLEWDVVRRNNGIRIEKYLSVLTE